MHVAVHVGKGWARDWLDRADAFCNRLYGWRANPLYHSGAIAVASTIVLLVTGIYLLLFYRIGAPYDSVARITDQVWVGRWMRGLHRYSSDVAIVAIAVHAARMFLQGRSWGPRALAWISGLILLFVFWTCGWTGYVMVWDLQAQLFATEGARFLDSLPIFSESIGRAFVGEGRMPGAFFFLNLFLHIALPIGVALILWIHVSRVARPKLLPPRRLLWASTLFPLALALLWPVAMAPEADPFTLPEVVPVDLFYGFFLPVSDVLPAWAVWVSGGLIAAILITVPLWTRPDAEVAPPPSSVDTRQCTGCEQCYVDCPYEAISMVVRSDGRDGLVAQVDPGLCVSCGICAGSCAPMGVGPPGRTGRDQIADVKRFIADQAPSEGEVVIVACGRGSGGIGGETHFEGAPVYPVTCAGSLHTSVVEYLVRAGAGGVLVVSCPPRDCWNREGAVWLEQRLFHDREAELQARVDRERVRLLYAGRRERSEVAAALTTFRLDVRQRESTGREADIDIDRECEVPIGTEAEVGT